MTVLVWQKSHDSDAINVFNIKNSMMTDEARATNK